MLTRVLLTALGAVLLAACGDADPVAPASAGDVGAVDPAGSWALVEAQPPMDVPPDARITLEVASDDRAWQVGGTAACNSYSGTVVTEGSVWRGEGYAVTEMACEEPRMAAERAYLDALLGVDEWSRPAADELVLSGSRVQLRFEALSPVPTADLTATTWLLDALLTGTGPAASVSAPVPEADDASLRLDPGGAVHASTGCRTFSGEWTEAGDEVLLTSFGQRADSPNVAADGTPTCDEAVIAQEDHVLSVLGDGFRAEVEGRRLTLTSRDGLGLSYRAADGGSGG
jgi:heat shock protein HslJ